MTPAMKAAEEIGGNLLVRFFDAIQAEQRKRWNAPDWREQSVADADRVNWRDVSAALALIRAEAAAVPADRPTAWMRGVRQPSTPNGPEEWDAEFVYGDDQPEGKGWVALYRQAAAVPADPYDPDERRSRAREIKRVFDRVMADRKR